jgi:LPXTG-site transpeptidase (sortase) family protein
MESNTGPMESIERGPREIPRAARLLLVPVRILLLPVVAFRSASRRLPRADLALVLATLTAIILVGGATVAVLRSNPTPSDLAFDAPTLVAVDATTTTLPETTSSTAVAAAPAPQTQPIAPPKEPRAKEPIVQIGEIQIPKIGLVHAVFEGVTLTVIDQGPGHWPGSARPGQLGNAVFAGHRVTHSHPFRNIDQLVPGDDIIFRTNDGVFNYKVTGSQVVTPKDVGIVTPTADATLTLFACHPPGSARQRYVVHAAFAGSTPA